MSTNPYDKYLADSPTPQAEVNPYEKYLVEDTAPSPRPAQPAAPRPAAAPKPRTYTNSEVVKGAITGFPASTARLAKGMVDAAIHPVNTATSLAEMASGGYIKILQAMPAASRPAFVDAHPDLFQPMIDKANAVGGMYRDRYGSVDGLKRTIAEDSAGFLADVSTLFALGGGVARGVAGSTRAGTKVAQASNALAKATNPLSPAGPLSWPSRGVEGSAILAKAMGQKQMGNALSTAAHFTDPRTPVNAMGRVAKHVAMGPKTALVLAAAENPTAVARAQRSPKQIVPNSPVTPAQAAVDVGSTKWAAMEGAARDRFSTEFGKLNDASNAARLAHADNVGHTPAIVEGRIRDRARDSARDYAVSDPVMTTVTPKVWDLLNRPGIKGVIQEAKDLAALKGEMFGTPPGVPMQWSGKDIHRIKTAIDERAFKKNPDGSPAFTASQIKGMRDVQKEFLRWVEQPGNNPAYAVGRKNYAEHSRAIARMHFGQYLKDLMQKPLTREFTAEQRADALAAALRDPITGNPHLKKATGDNFETRARDLLTPDEFKVFERIVDDMARARRVQDQASKGAKHKPMMENALTDWSLPNAFRTPGVVNTLARLVTGHGDERIAKEVGNAMQTTKGASTMLNDARTKRVAVRNTGKAIRKTAGVATRYPAMYNALNEQEPRN